MATPRDHCRHGPLVALGNNRDNFHSASVRLLSRYPGRLLVPSPVLAETCWMLESRVGTDAELKFLDPVRTGMFELVEPTVEDVDRIHELVAGYADLPLGATDASVVSIAERLGVPALAALDRLHFSVVRPRHIPAFTLLP
ncbi:type II toxin-antitoxin system VapC family toxin [Saccharopolyspora erythraea]|nr:PIN domain-containing protein [Saccharopolyspora erythraea]